MNRKFYGRLIAGTALVAVLIVLFFAATMAAPAASAAGGTCFDLMAPGATPQVIVFHAATYTVTVPAGTDVCVESGSELLLGFVGEAPFAVDGNGASAATAGGFLYALGPVSGTPKFNLTADKTVKLEITEATATGTAIVWLGTLKAAPVATPAATLTASATTMQVVGPGALTKGSRPAWDFTPITGTLSLEVQARVPFTLTSPVDAVPASNCGTSCWKASWDVEDGDGLIEAPELQGYWWSATLVGSTVARVLMPAPAAVASPASAKPPGGGGATGAAPEVWGAAPKIIGPTLPRGWGWALN